MKHEGKHQEWKRGTNNYKTRKTIFKMVIVCPSLLVLTLDVNGLNSPIRRRRVAEWI